MEPKILTDTAGILKNIPRTGWLQRGIPPSVAETVAEHSFEVASILAVIAMQAEGRLDKEKMLIMGTIHDWGEAVAGDIPRSLTNRLGKEAKSRAERRIMRELSTVSGFRILSELFEEYEGRKSDEAIVAKIADVLSTLRQAEAYSARGYNVGDILEGCKRELTALIETLKNKDLRKVVTGLM